MNEMDALKASTARLSILSNTVLFFLKLAVGFSVGAVSLISEALHSGIDLLASGIAFWAVRKSVTPPDLEHDYGHGKYENLSAATEALLVLAAAAGIVYEAYQRLGKASVSDNLHYGIIIMIISIIINYFVSRRLEQVAELTGSQALKADGLHLQSDIWTSVGVLIGLFLMWLTGWAWIDSLLAVCVAGIIFWNGWEMVKESLLQLTDASLPPEEEERIGKIIADRPEVLGYHCLRTRKSGSCKLLDVHVLFDGDMRLSQVHAICDELEQEIRRGGFGSMDILIHPEPMKGHVEETKEYQYEQARK